MFQSALTKEVLMNALTAEEQERVTKDISRIEFPKGQLIFVEKATPLACYFIEKGRVKLFRTGDLGKQQIFQICKCGDFFGFHPILKNARYPDGAETLEDCTLEVIPASLFKELIHSNHKLCLTLLTALSDEFERFIQQETMLSQKRVSERVATVLYFLLDLYQNNNSVIPLSRSDLAALCGTTKESLVRVLHEFKESAIIEVTNQHADINVLSTSELRKVGNIQPKSIR